MLYLKKSGNFSYHYQFSQLRARIKTYLKILYNNYLNKVEDSIPRSDKYFYQHINKLKKFFDLPASMVFENETPSHQRKFLNFLPIF